MGDAFATLNSIRTTHQFASITGLTICPKCQKQKNKGNKMQEEERESEGKVGKTGINTSRINSEWHEK